MTDAPTEREEEGAWAKLRRRKVVQWGIAYVAGAWGLLQGLAYLSTVFHWPEQMQRLATVGFIVGLPIVITLAWFHGDRGHQKVTGVELGLLTALLLAGGGLFWWVGRAPVAPAVPVATTGLAPAAAGPSIAVLPFVNESSDPANEYFADGITDEIRNVLVRVPGLGVVSRSSSFAYKGRGLGTGTVAAALKVGYLLEGSVRKSGDRVRITAELIDATSDRNLWSETYDRELTDIFAIQAEIANAIVSALRAQLSAAAAQTVTVRADTTNLEAYQIYLHAREIFIARSDLPESVRLFEKVTQMDPSFARGWEGLAAVCAIIESWGYRDRPYTKVAVQAADRALALDASLSMPWAVKGVTARATWPVDWAQSLEYLDRAIAADPRNATAYLWRAIGWMDLGFFDRALADLNRSIELEPGYPNAIRHKALTLLYEGHSDEALALFERGVAAGFVMSLPENFVGPLVARGNTLAAQLLMIQMGLTESDARSALIDALRKPGPVSPTAEAAVERALAAKEAPPHLKLITSHVYVWLGDFDKAGETYDGQTEEIVAWDRYPPGFRNSNGFKRKLTRNGVQAYWRAHGFPPQCRAAGEHDFNCD